MIFQPIYLWARFASVQQLVTLGRDMSKQDGWHTRFKIHGRGHIIVIPVSLKDRRGKRIEELHLHDPKAFFSNLAKTLNQHYSRQPQFNAVMDLIFSNGMSDLDHFETYCNLFAYRVITYLALPPIMGGEQSLGLEKPADASTWLADIGLKIGGTEYVCAADATEKYLKPGAFYQAGIVLSPQKYVMPQYPGCLDAETSIIDLLMRCSIDEARKVLLP
jgi:hypothetical protein